MALLIHLEGGVVATKFPLEKAEVSLGRAIDNDITLDDAAVSGHHARVVMEVVDAERKVVRFYIEDMNSTNGTFVNDQAIKRQPLHHDDTVRIAFHEFKFVNEDEPREEKTKKIHKSWIPGLFYTK